MPTAQAFRSPAHAFLDGLFRTAIAAAHPAGCLPAHLPPPPASGRLVDPRRRQGRRLDDRGGRAALPRRRTAAGQPPHRSRRHPPRLRPADPADRNGRGRASGARRRRTSRRRNARFKLADTAAADDLVLVLMSGGASANWIAPAHGLAFADKQAVTRALLRSGANIGEMNAVRKHLSRIKGGRLALRAQPARVVTLAISDVPGDDPAVIGSGPTVPDPSTLADARAVLARYRLDVPAVGAARARRSRQRDRRSRAIRCSPQRVQAGRTAGRRLPRRRGGGARRGLRVRHAGRPGRGRGARGRSRARPARASAGQPRAGGR